MNKDQVIIDREKLERLEKSVKDLQAKEEKIVNELAKGSNAVFVVDGSSIQMVGVDETVLCLRDMVEQQFDQVGELQRRSNAAWDLVSDKEMQIKLLKREIIEVKNKYQYHELFYVFGALSTFGLGYILASFIHG